MSKEHFLLNYGSPEHHDELEKHGVIGSHMDYESQHALANNPSLHSKHYHHITDQDALIGLAQHAPEHHVHKMADEGGDQRIAAIYSGRLSDEHLHSLVSQGHNETVMHVANVAKSKKTLDHIIKHHGHKTQMHYSLCSNPHLHLDHVKHLVNHVDSNKGAILCSAHAKDKDKAEVLFQNPTLHPYLVHRVPKDMLHKFKDSPDWYAAKEAKERLERLED